VKRPALRRAVNAVVRAAARLAAAVFFREVRVEEVGRLRDAPGARLLVAHHLNALVDPLLLFAAVPGPPRFLAKSTLWRHPVVAPLVILGDAIPVYRHQDGVDVAKNADTFRHAREILRAGGTVALFPEGRSHSEPAPLPLKTGAARIALHAAVDDRAPALRIVPIGIAYEDKGRFRSRVAVRIGEPIDPAPEAAAYPSEGRAAVHALTGRIAAGLAEATPRTPWPEDANRLRGLARVLLALPAAVGTALNWLPYRLPGWVAQAFSRTPDEPATYKILTALVAFPAVWALLAYAAWRAWGGPAAAAAALLAPATGWAALLFHDDLYDRH
jgi:1-acyl-sn-glycerol-3-phosphate acyltransferase